MPVATAREGAGRGGGGEVPGLYQDEDAAAQDEDQAAHEALHGIRHANSDDDVTNQDENLNMTLIY